MEKTIFIATGGTFGHIRPAITLYESIRKEAKVYFIGAHLDKNPFFDVKLPSYSISSANFSKGFWRGLWRLSKGVFQSLHILKAEAPSLVIGFGSFHTLPPLIAAKLLGIDVILYEPNRFPGKVNRFFARFAKKNFVAFEETKGLLKKSAQSVELMLKASKSVNREELMQKLGLDRAKKTVLFYGGSLGAGLINNLAIEVEGTWKDEIQTVVITGQADHERVKGILKHKAVFSFYKPIEELLLIADFAVTRAGAGTFFDLVTTSTPAIMIPYAAGIENHQLYNARYFEEVICGGIVLEEKNVLEEFTLAFEKMLREFENHKTKIQSKGMTQECSIIET